MTDLLFLKVQLPDPRFLVVFFVIFLLSAMELFSQCSVDIDFNSWSKVGHAENGNWSIEPNGSGVYQTINGDPTFFVSPNNFMNVKVSGTILVDENTLDDDYVGVIFSVLDPLANSTSGDVDFDLWLLDWKSGAQSSADEGFSLIKVNNTFDFDVDNSFMPYFWTHNSSADFQIKEQVFGEGLGWVPGVEHSFELTLFSNRVTVKVDGNTVIDRSDCFNVGRIGFYNFSQENVFYSNFEYEIFSDFSVPEELCSGENFTPELMHSECVNNTQNNLASIFTNWFWQFGDNEYSFEMLPSHLFEDPGEYEISLTVTDELGCSASSSQTLMVEEKAELEILSDSGCIGETLEFNTLVNSDGAEVLGYSWDINNDGIFDYSGSELATEFSEAGEYPISVIAYATGCNDTVQFSTTVYSPPISEFQSTVLSNRAVQFANTSSNADTYLWDFGDGTSSAEVNPVHVFIEDGNYQVTLRSFNNSCESVSSEELSIIYEDLTFIPTAFSPNGDGKNDLFRPKGNNFIEGELCIFNHWGELIHVSRDANLEWNGTVNGTNVQPGNYTYLINGTMLNGDTTIYQGIVTLIR